MLDVVDHPFSPLATLLWVEDLLHHQFLWPELAILDRLSWGDDSATLANDPSWPNALLVQDIYKKAITHNTNVKKKKTNVIFERNNQWIISNIFERNNQEKKNKCKSKTSINHIASLVLDVLNYPIVHLNYS